MQMPASSARDGLEEVITSQEAFAVQSIKHFDDNGKAVSTLDPMPLTNISIGLHGKCHVQSTY
ncbi:hypothetical protein N7461_001729 [Penicillium sp. DV-2018c]|nr:hypothetical protein N7461_001729 [Penicillium sp. DV-2018c]